MQPMGTVQKYTFRARNARWFYQILRRRVDQFSP